MNFYEYLVAFNNNNYIYSNQAKDEDFDIETGFTMSMKDLVFEFRIATANPQPITLQRQTSIPRK